MPLKILTPQKHIRDSLPQTEARIHILPRAFHKFKCTRRCAVGKAVLLRRSDPAKPYSICAAAPLYLGGLVGEPKKLHSCYISALNAAKRRKLKSVTFLPLPRGPLAFPPEKAMHIAVSAIGDWLLDNDADMDVYLLSHTRGSKAKSFNRLRTFIDSRCLFPYHLDVQEDGELSLSYTSASEESQAPFDSWDEEYCSTSEDGSFLPADRVDLNDTLTLDAVKPITPIQTESDAEENSPFYPSESFDEWDSSDSPSETYAQSSSESYFGDSSDSSLDPFFVSRLSEADADLRHNEACDEIPFSLPDAEKNPKGKPSGKRSPSVKSFSHSTRSIKAAPMWDNASAYAPAPSDLILPLENEVRRPVPRRLEDVLGQVGESFSQMLFRLIDQRGMSDPEVYKRANMDRRLFSKIRSNPNYQPAKGTVLALAIALQLNLDQTTDLLRRAGFALSPSSKSDLIVEFFIREKQFNIHEINAALFSFNQKLLGA